VPFTVAQRKNRRYAATRGRTLAGLVEAGLGRRLSAINSFQKALTLDPEYVDAMANLGATYIGLDRIDTALRLLREANRLEPNNAKVLANLAVAHNAIGELDAAITFYESALSVSPHNPSADVLFNLAALYHRTGRTSEAQKTFTKAKLLNPSLQSPF